MREDIHMPNGNGAGRRKGRPGQGQAPGAQSEQEPPEQKQQAPEPEPEGPPPPTHRNIILRNANNYAVEVTVVIGLDDAGNTMSRTLELPRHSESSTLAVLEGYAIELPGRVSLEDAA